MKNDRDVPDPDPSISHEVAEIRQRLEKLDAERAQLRQRLQEIQATSTTSATVTATSSPQDKIHLFRSLFRGRTDVFPRRWQNAKTGKKGFSPACRNEWVPGVCQKPKVKCSDCPHQAFISVDDDVIAQHLRGALGSGSDRGDEFVIGIYPILPDNSCWFLAVDFDGKMWESDAKSYLDSCRAHQISENADALYDSYYFVNSVSEEREEIAKLLKDREAELSSGKFVTGLQISSSNACNFACSYCFADTSESRSPVRSQVAGSSPQVKANSGQHAAPGGDILPPRSRRYSD